MNKGGQFFILAAVIISAIVLSVGAISNYAHVNENRADFEDFSFKVKEETGAVVNYAVYSGFDNDDDLENFLGLLSAYITDREPEASFMFIYGDRKSITIENHWSSPAYVSAEEQSANVTGGRSEIKSSIVINGVITEITEYYDSIEGGGYKVTLDNNGQGFGENSEIEVIISNKTFSFPILNYKQVIFLIGKEEGDEIYISAK